MMSNEGTEVGKEVSVADAIKMLRESVAAGPLKPFDLAHIDAMTIGLGVVEYRRKAREMRGES